MNENQLKIQAYLDEELSADEKRQVESAVLQDPEARALLAELKLTRDFLAGYEHQTKLPESREFYWSKIERGIRAAELISPARNKVGTSQSWWRKWLMPAGAFAALVIAGWLAGTQTGFFGTTPPLGESSIGDTGAFTYRDFTTGTTLVWLSYPAEN